MGDIETGVTNWLTRVHSKSTMFSAGLVGYGGVLFVGEHNGYYHLIIMTDGKERATIPTLAGSHVGGPIVNYRVYLMGGVTSTWGGQTSFAHFVEVLSPSGVV